jgi:pimeloyl-ACP methyl ester carboxylesterase/DNA-binding winged helix-turn-helix (wHTH) protein
MTTAALAVPPPSVPAPRRPLAFGPFCLDPVSGQLRGAAGPLPLTPKALAVLEHLARRPGQLVTKTELIDALWPGVFVGDGALKTCIREIRKALDDDAGAPRYIETAHRRGYRFVAPVSERPHAPSFPAPRVRYARSGDVNIAYQVVGDGPLDLVFVMGWVSHLEYFWNEPSFARFLTRLASFSRLILFDKRGTGLSDPVSEPPTLEQRMDDVRAVMDAVGSRRAALLGVSEGGPLCSLFAATYPEKAAALVMVGTYAKRLRDADYPWGTTFAEREAFCEEIVRGWAGPVGIEQRAPGRAHDPAFRQWWASYLRMGASPGAAVALTRMNAEIDVRGVLPTIRVPTLVLHRGGDRCLRAEEGRYVASLVPGAQYVELPGDDHLPFVGDQDALLDHVESFLTGPPGHAGASDHVLATVLCARLEAGPDTPARRAALDSFSCRVRQEVPRFRGRGLELRHDGLTAAFDGPARAIRCGLRLAEAAAAEGLGLRVGLHTGECAQGDLPRGRVADVGDQIAARAAAGEVLVSRTVVDLVAGSGLRFAERPFWPLGGAQADWPVFAVVPDHGCLDLPC